MPYIALAPRKCSKTAVENGHRVADARAAALTPHTQLWRKGKLVPGNNTIAIRTAIATFDENGRYGNKVGPPMSPSTSAKHPSAVK